MDFQPHYTPYYATSLAFQISLNSSLKQAPRITLSRGSVVRRGWEEGLHVTAVKKGETAYQASHSQGSGGQRITPHNIQQTQRRAACISSRFHVPGKFSDERGTEA